MIISPIAVASFTDAWIETNNLLTNLFPRLSHLLQMRGLKQEFRLEGDEWSKVASFTDAWIETISSPPNLPLQGVASFTDAWIETGALPVSPGFSFVASFTDAWIETSTLPSSAACQTSHLLQMRGLKLRLQARAGRQLQVASFTDAWIETLWLVCELPSE